MITKKVGYKRKQRVKDDVGHRTAQREMTPPLHSRSFPLTAHDAPHASAPPALPCGTSSVLAWLAGCCRPIAHRRHRVVRKTIGQLFAGRHRPSASIATTTS